MIVDSHVRYALTTLLVSLACGSCGDASAVLLDDDHESELRRLRMDITVIPHGSTTSVERSVAEVSADLVAHCSAQRRVGLVGGCHLGQSSCDTQLCEAEQWLCVAQTAMLAATGPGTLVLNDSAGAPKWDVQPQDAESQVALAHAAQLAAAKSMDAAAQGLLGASCAAGNPASTSWRTSGAGAVGVETTPPAGAAERYASTLAEALRVGEWAADLGTQRALGVAERDASAIRDLGRAARLTWFDESLSRVLAAQAQVGGTSFGTVAAPTDWHLRAGEYADPVLRGVGIGVVPPCGVNCTRALEALRLSGVPFPALVPILSAPYDFSATPSQLTSIVPTIGFNLNERIAHDATTYATTTPEALAASIGVSIGDLLQAVEQMRYEDVVYTRPRGIALAHPIRVSPSATGAQRFRPDLDPTTLGGPVPPPVMHYLTRARTQHLWTGSATFTSGRSLRLPILRPERAHLFAYARALASEALALSYVNASPNARVALQSIIQQANARRALDVEVCSTGVSARVRVYGLDTSPASEEFRMVQGTNALRCAVHGVLEGQPCTTTMLQEPASGWLPVGGDGSGRLSRLHAVQFDVASVTQETYLVRLRPGATAGLGAYEAIAGFGNVSAGQCTTIPFDWMSYTSAASIFDFSEDARTTTSSCAGVPSRLPLEDEIIDDGDGYEDSWQHHLRIASSVSAHADQLGQDLIAAGLRMDEESERRIDELQQLCGTHVNVDLFSDGQIHPTAVCSESGTPGCPTGYACVGTTCVSTEILGPEGSAQRDALEDCLGLGEGGEIVPVVALGRDPLCAWRNKNHPDQLCTGSTARCPYVMPRDGVCALPSGLSSSDYEVVAVTNEMTAYPDVGQTLGLVGTVGPNGEPHPGQFIPGQQCTDQVLQALDTLRSSSSTRSQRDLAIIDLRTSGFFEFENVQAVARRVGWIGEPGNISQLRVDGGPMRDNSGTIIGRTGFDGAPLDVAPTAPIWPCTTNGGGVGTDSSPLRSRYVFCASTEVRARMNWRLGRAAVVLTALTDNGLSNHRMPAFPYDSGAIDMDFLESVSTVRVGGRDYTYATSADFVGYDLSGSIFGDRGGGTPVELWRSANDVRVMYHVEAGPGTTCPTDGVCESGSDSYHWAYTNTRRPLSFLNFGYQVADDNRERADAVARRMWENVGMSRGDSSPDGSSNIWDVVLRGDTSDLRYGDNAAASQRVFYRALTRPADEWHRVYIEPAWDPVSGNTAVTHITHIFNAPTLELADARNVAHLFATERVAGEVPPQGYGAYITRRDLLDAMELACYVSTLQPPPPDMLTDEDRPQVNGIGDVAQVENFAERVAQAFDAMARVQVVRDVPRDVIDRLTAENVGNTTSEGSAATDRVSGEYGQLLSELRTSMRAMGESPTRIAAILRMIASEVRIFERDTDSFNKTLVVRWLRLAVSIMHSTISCLSAISSANGNTVNTLGNALVLAGAICVLDLLIVAAESVVAELEVSITNNERANEVDRWGVRMSELFDALDSERTAFLNAVDSVQAVTGRLRDSRTASRSALARALFASSDAAGRQYATNTVMRRLYDINLQRYQESRDSAVRSAAIARFAIEQRFGVNLETQQCAQLVERPSTWANDICTATGVDYGALRNPDVEFDQAAIRQLFIGDYVRRLEQYVESYRFDYPYQSGDDLMVMSLRDDVVRARSTCPVEVANWVGSSNDLFAAVVPVEDGSPGSEPGWAQRSCAGDPPYVDCVALVEVPGPRFEPAPGAVAPPVFALSDGHAPRGFEVTFAPNPGGGSYAGDYQNGASYTQESVLPAGLYRLSWYARSTGTPTVPTVTVRPLVGSVTVTGPVDAEPRPLADGWERYFRLIDVPSSMANETFRVGVFATDVSPVAPQSLHVAGIQLEHVSGTTTEDAYRSNAVLTAAAHGPSLFAATTAPGFGYVDDCVVGDPRSFRAAWRYACAQLCTGGFSGHCNPGESPQQFCYWELPFSLDEDRLLSRGGDFGGGFAFGNYNYRSGEIAVNVVGTGVRSCDGGTSACYATAGVPFSLIHTAPAASTLGGGNYSIRAHDGSLHPVDLFDGRIESARALAAERYLTNPLSSSDAALINDYVRGELRGRPMTGNYRLLIWDNGEVNFAAIEDVQVLWRYRYFTRTGSAYVCE